MMTSVTTPLTSFVSVQLASPPHLIVSEPALKVVSGSTESELASESFVVPASATSVTTLMLWVTSQPAEVVSGRTTGGAMTVGV